MSRHPNPSLAFARDSLLFVRRVITTFMQNQGLLLAGAVAYYMLLSILPLLILLVLALSPFLAEEQLLSTLSRYLDLMAPGLANAFLVGDVAVTCDPTPKPFPIGATLITPAAESPPVR